MEVLAFLATLAVMVLAAWRVVLTMNAQFDCTPDPGVIARLRLMVMSSEQLEKRRAYFSGLTDSKSSDAIAAKVMLDVIEDILLRRSRRAAMRAMRRKL